MKVLFYKLYFGALELLGLAYCNECDKWLPKDQVYEDLCEQCQEHLYCECGQILEDSCGSKGDGLCIRCR